MRVSPIWVMCFAPVCSMLRLMQAGSLHRVRGECMHFLVRLVLFTIPLQLVWEVIGLGVG